MVNSSEALDATFGALADPTRRAILARLARAPESSVGELARPFSMSLPAISKHLAVLEDAGLLARRKDGRVHHCRLVGAPMQEASDWIAVYSQFWDTRLGALQTFLEAGEDEEEKPWKRRSSRSASRGQSGPRGRGSSGRGRSPS
ncbi:MAG TPA: metalloregulator ArsR/SmtB family transcription factor [Thermoanaerobaculia bacterium]